jgi:hypothetical protein
MKKGRGCLPRAYPSHLILSPIAPDLVTFLPRWTRVEAIMLVLDIALVFLAVLLVVVLFLL